MDTSDELPERAADTTAHRPWPVRVLSLKIAGYVDKMSPLWVEGQIVQLNRRDRTAYLVLRDPEVDMSLSVTIPTVPLDACPTPLAPGSRVVVHAKPTFWARRGTLQLEARAVRPVGIGDLLARIEVLKTRLAAEGLFDPARRVRLPRIPRTVGLITGRDSAAERDVVDNARRRWPTVRFAIRHVPVQGPQTVEAVCQALADLDADRQVDVIVITRGGGAVEELLPFSNETLVRAVARTATPVVSAIGHEIDSPLLDLVADARASTPTDAAKLVVPDAAAEAGQIMAARDRMRTALRRALAHERQVLAALTSRRVLASPHELIAARRHEIDTLTERVRTHTRHRLERATDQLTHVHAHLRLLSPQATLDRGYAIVRHADGRIVMRRDAVHPDELLHILVAQGDFGVRVVGADTPSQDASCSEALSNEGPSAADAPPDPSDRPSGRSTGQGEPS